MRTNSKEFKQLQKKWYDKLEKSGFVDIETRNGRLDKGKVLNNIVSHYNQSTFKQKEDYYRFAGQFLNEYEFKSKKEKLIWELHSVGVSIRNIVKALNKKRFVAYRRQVHEIVQHLVAEMKLRVHDDF